MMLFPFVVYAQDSIQVGYGAEDMALDTFMGRERIIVSCNDWQGNGTETGLWTIAIATGKSEKLKVVFPNDQYKLRPHGMHIAKSQLYVINHPEKNDPINLGKKRKDRVKHEILRFRLIGDSAVMETSYQHKLMKAPNDVHAVSASEFYWTNSRIFFGSVCKWKDGRGRKIIRNKKFPNGLYFSRSPGGGHTVRDNIIFSCTVSGKIYIAESFWSSNEESKFRVRKLVKLKGGDNFTQSDSGLVIACHPNLNKLRLHVKGKSDVSPVRIYELCVNRFEEKGEVSPLFQDEGRVFSAAATGLVYKNNLYLSQLVGNIVLKLRYTKP